LAESQHLPQGYLVDVPGALHHTKIRHRSTFAASKTAMASIETELYDLAEAEVPVVPTDEEVP
jgi:hypothetical protein